MTSPRKLPDDRPWITAYTLSETSGRLVDKAGREVSNREFLHRTGWTLQQVRKRMRAWGLSLDEAINVPPPKRGGRIHAATLMNWVVDVYRPWVAGVAGKLPVEAAPPPPALPQPNGPEPAPEPPVVAVPEASQPFTLRIEAVTPDLVLKAFEAMADRLDAIEAQLATLNKELH